MTSKRIRTAVTYKAKENLNERDYRRYIELVFEMCMLLKKAKINLKKTDISNFEALFLSALEEKVRFFRLQKKSLSGLKSLEATKQRAEITVKTKKLLEMKIKMTGGKRIR